MNKLKNILIILFVLHGVTICAQKVSNITYRQEQSNIIVSYDLETKTPSKVTLYVSTNGGASWQGPLKKVIGDVGAKIVSGSNSITWNVLEEFEELSGANIKFQVRAELSNTQSIASINKAIIKNPKDAKLFKLRGDLKYELDNTDGAIADYTKAISLNPKYADAYKARGNLMFSNYDAAISDYSKAISLNPKDASTFYDRANSKSGLEDYKGAIFDYSKALELEPNNTKFLFAKARAKRDLKDNIGAVEDSNKIIELDSTFENIYYFRGLNKFDLDDVEGANYDFEKHIKNSNNRIYVYNRIAAWRWNYKDYKTAIVYFTKAINILPVTRVDTIIPYEYIGRGFSKYKLKDYSGANSDFDNFIEKHYDKASAYKEIAIGIKYSFKEIGDFENSIKYLTKAIELEPNVNLYSERGLSKVKIKDYIGAIADYSKAIEFPPDLNYYYKYYKSRGDAKYILNDYRGAIADYSKAIEFCPIVFYLTGYYKRRGDAKYNLNDFSGSIEDYTKAIKLEPKDELLYYDRGWSKHDLKDYKGAIADYTKSILLNPNYGNSYLGRGYSKIAIKDKAGACKDFSKAGELGEEKAYEAINENCNK